MALCDVTKSGSGDPVRRPPFEPPCPVSSPVTLSAGVSQQTRKGAAFLFGIMNFLRLQSGMKNLRARRQTVIDPFIQARRWPPFKPLSRAEPMRLCSTSFSRFHPCNKSDFTRTLQVIAPPTAWADNEAAVLLMWSNFHATDTQTPDAPSH